MRKPVPKDSILIPDTAKRVFEGVIYEVYQWPQAMFDGSSQTFEMLKRPDTVMVVCVVDDQILVIDNEQPNSGSHKSLPGGRVDKTDNSITDSARREVLEETGYSFNNWRLIKVWQPHSKIEWFVYLLLAWEPDSQQEPSFDVGEKITLHKLPFDEFKDLVINQTGHLGSNASVIKKVSNIQQLLALPEFSGPSLER